MAARTPLTITTKLASSRPCVFCQHRLISSTSRRQAQPQPTHPKSATTSTSPPTTPSTSPTPPKTVSPPPGNPNRPHIRARDGELVPKPLARALGLPFPPSPGQNSGTDTRSWRQRRDDFASYDKHLGRRQELIKDLYEKNYFRDIGNIGVVHKGKSILAPGTVYKAGLAQYFPNLQGRTLKSGDEGTTDTTPVLRGRVSVVSVLSSEWARAQCQSFVGVGAAQNPGLDAYLNEAGVRDVAQTVEINVEENMLKHGLVRMFMGSMRRQRKEEDWGKYFLVSRGLSDDIREALAIWNMKVGSVYLVDGMCRIRWAGNGDAKEEEKQSLVRCLKRLVDEQRGVMKLRRQEPTKIGSAASPTAARSVSVAA